MPEEGTRGQSAESERSTRIVLGAIVLAYVFLAGLYALLTPAWQVPDEPAHYNYIRQLVEERRLPVLEPADYSQPYLDQIVAERFPAHLPVDQLEYEDHQPTLYYVLATPVYLVSRGSLTVLRLFSALIGLGLIPLAYLIVRDLYPDRPRIALAAAAMVAFIPQHVAMLASVNNDSLSEVSIAAVLWMTIRLSKGKSKGVWERAVLGIILGLALLTKLTAYPAIALAIGAVYLKWKKEENHQQSPILRFVWDLVVILGPAILIALPWYVRNSRIYGWPDVLGLIQHGQVTLAQPRTQQWIADYGFFNWLSRGMVMTFQSFWAQLGWMSVPMDFRIYQLLALCSGLAIWGWAAKWKQGRKDAFKETGGSTEWKLLGLLAGLTVFGFCLYNVSFVQHQGRYLFPALIPIAILFALGTDYWLQPRSAFRAGLGLWCVVVLLIGYGVLRSDFPGWPILMSAVLALGLWVVSILPDSWCPILLGVPSIMLLAINLHALSLLSTLQ